MQSSLEPLRHSDYTVGWICALPVELTAAEAMLDEVHTTLRRKSSDDNLYNLGSIGLHNVVIVSLPFGIMGNNIAANVASDLMRSFESIKFGVMVDIGGGVPTNIDIRLVDIAVSKPDGKHSGVVQYDFGKRLGEGEFERGGALNKPHVLLLSAIARLEAMHKREEPKLHKHISTMVEAHRNLAPASVYPGEKTDVLFEAAYKHEDQATNCDQCDPCRIKWRPPRAVKSPVIHYGNIVSGNGVMRDAKFRDRLARDEKIICFEMESAGLMDRFRCLVIRGICDYADSHKNKQWQPYAAVVAAAYAKELLLSIPAEVRTSQPAGDVGRSLFL